jgi:DNA polymerase-1
MIYLVTMSKELFPNDTYTIISVEESFALLNPLKVVGLDTETEGLDPWTKRLKSLQLGCKDFQVVIDCLTVDVCTYKDYLESDRIFLGWNLKFDLKFLYRHGIYPRKVYDGYLAEKLLWLGYPNGMHSLSLKSACENYLGIELDKSVRGKIIWAGLTADVVLYAANDVKYLEDIIRKQYIELRKKGLTKAIQVENRFVLPLAYCEYCGIKLDEEKWKAKMQKDQKKLDESRNALNNWVIQHFPKDSRFTKVDLQGDLFLGFNTDPICTINWSSPKQVIPLLKELGFNLLTKDKKTGEMKDSIDAKVIEPQKDVSDIAPIYIEYKTAAKVVGTYGENFLKQINPVSHRIHTNYQQMGADTTRITSGGKDKSSKVEYVNLLNLPADEETRACFVAEPGNLWISIDYSGQETYLMASIANDQAIIKELTEGSGDIHSLTAYMSYKEIPRDTPIKDIKKLYHNLRQEAKGIEFAINKILIFNYKLC